MPIRAQVARVAKLEHQADAGAAPPLMILWSRDSKVVAVSVNGEDMTPTGAQAYCDEQADKWSEDPYTYRVNLEPCL